MATATMKKNGGMNWSEVRDRLAGTGPRVIRTQVEGTGLKSWQHGGKVRSWVREYVAKQPLEANTVIVFEPPLPPNAVILPAATVTGTGPVGSCSIGLFRASGAASGAVEPVDATRLAANVTPGDRCMAIGLGDDGVTHLRPLESPAWIGVTLNAPWGAGARVAICVFWVAD